MGQLMKNLSVMWWMNFGLGLSEGEREGVV
jgi:hypothetical protein